MKEERLLQRKGPKQQLQGQNVVFHSHAAVLLQAKKIKGPKSNGPKSKWSNIRFVTILDKATETQMRVNKEIQTLL